MKSNETLCNTHQVDDASLICWQCENQDREDRQRRPEGEADVILTYCSLLILSVAKDVNLKKVSEQEK